MGPQLEPLRPLLESGRVDALQPDYFRQQWWTSATHRGRLSSLRVSATHRDAVRLFFVSQPHAGSWLNSHLLRPSPPDLPTLEYQLLLKWWLGMPLRISPDLTPLQCPLCPAPLDPWGDHLVTCKSNKPLHRHHAQRDLFVTLLREAHRPCRIEVAIVGLAAAR